MVEKGAVQRNVGGVKRVGLRSVDVRAVVRGRRVAGEKSWRTIEPTILTVGGPIGGFCCWLLGWFGGLMILVMESGQNSGTGVSRDGFVDVG